VYVSHWFSRVTEKYAYKKTFRMMMLSKMKPREMCTGAHKWRSEADTVWMIHQLWKSYMVSDTLFLFIFAMMVMRSS
jgi:hypothetical protein